MLAVIGKEFITFCGYSNANQFIQVINTSAPDVFSSVYLKKMLLKTCYGEIPAKN
jgi:hypothetical protein